VTIPTVIGRRSRQPIVVTDNCDVLSVIAVVVLPEVVLTVSNGCLGACTVDVVQPDGTATGTVCIVHRATVASATNTNQLSLVSHQYVYIHHHDHHHSAFTIIVISVQVGTGWVVCVSSLFVRNHREKKVKILTNIYS